MSVDISPEAVARLVKWLRRPGGSDTTADMLEALAARVAELEAENARLRTVQGAARVLLDAPHDEMTDFAIKVMRNNRLKDGKRIGYQPAIVAALEYLTTKEPQQ